MVMVGSAAGVRPANEATVTKPKELQKPGLRFVAADMPEANELTVGIMAAEVLTVLSP
jgi:hypothetical protein